MSPNGSVELLLPQVIEIQKAVIIVGGKKPVQRHTVIRHSSNQRYMYGTFFSHFNIELMQRLHIAGKYGRTTNYDSSARGIPNVML